MPTKQIQHPHEFQPDKLNFSKFNPMVKSFPIFMLKIFLFSVFLLNFFLSNLCMVIPYFIFRVFCTITAARTQKQKERKEKINEFKENCRCYTYNVTLADPDFIVCYMQNCKVTSKNTLKWMDGIYFFVFSIYSSF